MGDQARAIAACVASALALAGCGSADEDGVRSTIRALERALQRGDPAAVCRLYASGRDFCRAHFGPAELRSVGFGGRIEVLRVDVREDVAAVWVENVRDGRRVPGVARLRRVGERWLLVPPGG